jgi:uncharacterized membrane protein
MKNTAGYVLLFFALICAIVFAGYGLRQMDINNDAEQAKQEAVAVVIDTDDLPTLAEFENATVMDAGAMANYSYAMAVLDDEEDMYTLDKFVEVVETMSDDRTKDNANSAWAPVAFMALMVVFGGMGLFVVIMLKKSGGK